MYAISRPFAAAGVAIVGSGAIAMSPVLVAPPDVHGVSVALSATATDWAEVVATAQENASALYNSWRAAPAPILQQILANQQQYLHELPDVAGIAAQIQSNFHAALAAPLAVDLSTLDTTHRTFYQLLPAIEQLPGIPDLLQISISPTGKQLLALSTTALSGVLLGVAGPVLGPLVVLASGMASINSALTAQTPDVTGALATLADLPAAMADAFLNGGEHVDLTALVKAVGPAIGVSFPDGVQVGVALGGLLSQGGSAFNALDFAYDNDLLGVLHIHVPLATGTPVGPIGSMMEFARTIAKAIGWDGVANPAAAQTAFTHTAPAAANEVPSSVRASVVTQDVDQKPAAATGGRGAKTGTAHRAATRSGSRDSAATSTSTPSGPAKAGSKRAARAAS